MTTNDPLKDLHLSNQFMPFDGRDVVISILAATPGSPEHKREIATMYIEKASKGSIPHQDAVDIIKEIAGNYFSHLIGTVCLLHAKNTAAA